MREEGKATASDNAEISTALIYNTIRQEILDQKKCQFQLFSIAVTVTAAILAFESDKTNVPVVYVAPIVMNTLALIVIIDKAISIQRKVGYLQMIEGDTQDLLWKWETHLDAFRKYPEDDESRVHSYVTMILTMLTLLNFLCAGLFRFGPSSLPDSKPYVWLEGIVYLTLIFGLSYAFRLRNTLVAGKNSAPNIRRRWKAVRDHVRNQQQ